MSRLTSKGNNLQIGSALVMLDLSAAFDVLDHKILQTPLEHSFGVTGSALPWIKSDLSDRSQCVAIGMTKSEDKCLNFGVPQGSVLGPRISTVCLQNQLVRYVANIICSTTVMQMIPGFIWRSCPEQLGPKLQRNGKLAWLISVLR